MPHETLGGLLCEGRRRLRLAGCATPGLDARLLLQHAASVSHEAMVAEPETAASPCVAEGFEQMLRRRLAGEPVSRILGEREFFGRVFTVCSAVLDPRPETEILVAAALEMSRTRFSFLDLGTGSGAIAVTLLAERPEARGTATDLSSEALAAAAGNSRRLGVSDRLELMQSDWFGNVTENYDVIVSNPPYIRTGDIGSLPPDVAQFDPRTALDGGKDGLTAYRIISSGAERHLRPGGRVIVEIGAGQAEDVIAIFARAGLPSSRPWRDLQGHVRCLAFERQDDAAK